MSIERLGGFRARNPENKVRAPELAYYVVYGRRPLKQLMLGRSMIPQKRYKNMLVDENIPDHILDELNTIPNIEIRSSCEGHDSDHVSFIVIRPKNQRESYIRQLVGKINKCPNTHCGYDVGNGGLFRICIATKNWYRGDDADNSKWLKWWENLPNCIKKSL